MTGPFRRGPIAAAACVLLVVVAHTLLWRWAEGQLASGFESWAAAQRLQGWTVTAGPRSGGGWPLAATLTVADLSLSGGPPDVPDRLAWTAQHVVLRVALLRPRSLVVTPGGRQGVRLGDGPEMPYTADHLAATIPLDPDMPPRAVDILGNTLRLELPQGGPAPGALSVGLLQARLDSAPAAAQGEAALTLSASAQDIALPAPAGRVWPLGSRIASISIEGALTGPLPRAPDPVLRATEWRDGGGTLEIHRLALGWGPLGLSATATLALDDRLQPMGAASAHVVGEAATLDALVAARTIGANTAMAVRVVLGLLARAPDGAAPQVDVPLTLQNRMLSMGRIPVAKLPELAWPQPAPPL